jgi:signal transduction histidine kinase/DNA-binding response OmpR family regulator
VKDRNGGYWFASYTGGLNYYHPQNNLFSHYKRIAGSSKGLTDEVVNGFQEDQQGNLWIATGASGLNYLNLKTNQFENARSGNSKVLSGIIVKSMAADRLGNLWLGTYSGLYYFNRQSEVYTRYSHDPLNSNSLNQNQVHSLHVDKEGLVWIGMNGGDFQVFNPLKNSFEVIPGVGKIIGSIYEDRQGKLWIGDRFGLKCLDRVTRKLVDISNLTANAGEELNFINWISEDSKGRLWIGTQSSGLFIIKSDSIYRFGKENGFTDNTVNAVLEDNNGLFWISTTKGISGIEYSENKLGIPKITSTDYTSANGLQGEQFNPGSAIKTSSGKLYFGGTNGFNAFYPGEINKEVFFPKVTLSEILINSETDISTKDNFQLSVPVNECKELILKYKQRNIFLRFAGINFVNPDGTYYRYMLSGLDKDWIDIGNQRTINFTYLPIGMHELRIKASTSSKLWGDDYKSLKIRILPPWWKTWWAYLSYFLLLTAIMTGFFIYIQRLAELRHRLSMEQYMREKEQKLLESKLDFFTDVSHELRTPLTLILAPLEKILMQSGLSDQLYQQLQLIQRNGNRMMRMVSQVLNLRKLEAGQHDELRAAKGNIGNFLKEISLAFGEMAASRNITFHFDANPGNFKLWYDRNKMEIIMHNLLSNAFKHATEGGEVSLRLELRVAEAIPALAAAKCKGEYAEISITNNGKGIAPENIGQIFERFYSGNNDFESNSTGVGLDLTKRMVELHKGYIFAESQTESENSSGSTTFSVYLPMGKSHLTSREIIADFKNSEDLSRYTKELKLKEKVGNLISLDADIELPSISDKDKQTLLLVEDNAEVRTFIKSLFIDNYLVEEAENGKTGWEIASSVLPDLVISDIMMPEMNGIELCRKLKTDVRTSHIPVILLTARTILTFKYEGYETGADEYITKPFSSEYLIMRVKILIKQRNTMRSHFEREAILRPENITVTSVDEKLLKKAVDYINNNLSNPSISVEKLSSELGLSRVHFYRKIKSLTNLTAVDFIRTIRLKSAAMLLQQNKLTIKEIQNRVGFESADYFRKSFKEHFGVSPSEYARINSGKKG